jgi:hypothetical protein
LIAQVEAYQDLHRGEIARLKKELRVARAESESLRLVVQSAYLALSAVRGLAMTPTQRDRVRGARVATGRAMGITHLATDHD